MPGNHPVRAPCALHALVLLAALQAPWSCEVAAEATQGVGGGVGRGLAALLLEPPPRNPVGAPLLGATPFTLMWAGGQDVFSAGWYLGESVETAAARFCGTVAGVARVGPEFTHACSNTVISQLMEEVGQRVQQWPKSLVTAPLPLLQLPAWVADAAIMTDFARRKAPQDWQRAAVPLTRLASSHSQDLPPKDGVPQVGEDEHAYQRYFYGLRGGTFLESGAVDGVEFSVSYALDKDLGWHGVRALAMRPAAPRFLLAAVGWARMLKLLPCV
jgi:hypothetical protein